MDRFTQHDLRSLWDNDEPPCVSIYMPTHRGGPELRELPIRMKNLARGAQEALEARGMRATEAERLLAPVRSLMEDTEFWHRQSEGLAVFRSPTVFTYYRLPQAFAEFVRVAGQFHTKPLLRELAYTGAFYVLALSRNAIRLFRATREDLADATPADMPRSLPDFLRYDEIDKAYQYRRGGSGKRESQGSVSHGGREEDKKYEADLRRFFRGVDDTVRRHLDPEGLPLLWAGVEELHALYREVNTYAGLMAEFIAGNPDRINPARLQEEAWKVVQPLCDSECEAELERLREMASSPRVSTNLSAIVPAAHQGRVETFFFSLDREQWGFYAPDTGAVELHREPENGDGELMDLAAWETLRNGGRVRPLTMERMTRENVASGVAALLRY